MKKRKVYRGWIDPGAIPVRVEAGYVVTFIPVYNRKSKDEHRAKITVEWTEPKRGKK